MTDAATPRSQSEPQDGRYPSQIKYIIGNEACERFSYYGMVGILELYLTQQMKISGPEATTTQHLFGTAVYLLPLAGGWLADRWLGRYWTILIISLFYCLGHGSLAISEGSWMGLYVGLALIAVGAGGIKPCVSSFVGDQFKPSQHHLLTNAYGWFYWAINLGSAAAFLLISPIRHRWGYGWAFGVPGIAMGLATFIFWLGRKQYVRQPTQREVGRTAAEASADRKSLLRIALVFLPVPMFWALFNQTSSTWVLQGAKMTPFSMFSYEIDGETMQAGGAVLVMIWTPILTLVLYPLAERLGWRPTALRRMTLGMFLGAFSFVITGLVQARMDHGQPLSILWQLAPYVVLEAGEVLLSATGLEFAFQQAPARLKSVVTSFWLMTIAGGHFLIAVITGLNERFVHASGTAQFYFYAAMMFLVAVIFAVCASLYRPTDPVAS
ncbi:MAG TPA: POT family MFS transporter [Candidatus Cybelea sp.]|jgi:POT family proton-dependent oligopeptide transporter|nr:POT family MFS transporter [Candidatus Cybelea sp.]